MRTSILIILLFAFSTGSNCQSPSETPFKGSNVIFLDTSTKDKAEVNFKWSIHLLENGIEIDKYDDKLLTVVSSPVDGKALNVLYQFRSYVMESGLLRIKILWKINTPQFDWSVWEYKNDGNNGPGVVYMEALPIIRSFGFPLKFGKN